MTVKANLAWQDAIIRENRCRRSYWLGRFGSNALPKKGDDGIFDPYNNDKVPAISVHRAVAIPEIAGHKSWERFRTGKNVVRLPTETTAKLDEANKDSGDASASVEVVEPGQCGPSRSTQRSTCSSRSVASLRTAISEAVESELAKAGLASLK
eukprot:s3165_g8.t1